MIPARKPAIPRVVLCPDCGPVELNGSRCGKCAGDQWVHIDGVTKLAARRLTFLRPLKAVKPPANIAQRRLAGFSDFAPDPREPHRRRG
jgi:hypothetical protein